MQKYFFIFYCLFSIGLSAQTDNSKTTKLTKAEVNQAKVLFSKMLNTPTYKESQDSSLLFTYKMNGVPFPRFDEKIRTEEGVKKLLNDYLSKNLSKTKFKTKEECISLAMKNINLIKKLYVDNASLYELLSRANLEQTKEIYEVENSFDRRYDNAQKIKKIKKTEEAN